MAQFRDLRAVLESIEQTKTAIRAMGKYVPVDLVRDLYSMNREPLLGGDVSDVSLMFTDIMGFTGIAERLSSDPDRLAVGWASTSRRSRTRSTGTTASSTSSSATR